MCVRGVLCNVCFTGYVRLTWGSYSNGLMLLSCKKTLLLQLAIPHSLLLLYNEAMYA